MNMENVLSALGPLDGALLPQERFEYFKDTNTDLKCDQEHLWTTRNQNAGLKHDTTVTNVFPYLK